MDQKYYTAALASLLLMHCCWTATAQEEHTRPPVRSLQPQRNNPTPPGGGQRYSGPLWQNPGGTSFSTDLHVHGSFSEGNASMESVTEAVEDVGLDVVWWSDHDGFFTHYHMISTFSFEDWDEPASANEPWTAATTGEANQDKLIALESLDPMEYHDAQITPAEAYQGINSLRLSCSSSSSAFESLLYRFDADTKRNKRALGSDVSVQVAVFPESVTENARGFIEIILSLHLPASSSDWQQFKLRYFLHPDPQLPRSLDGGVYNIPVPFTEDEWNLLDLQVTADAIEGFSWLTGIDNSLFQLNIGVESSMGDTAVVFFDDLQFSSTLMDTDVLDVQRVMMDSLQQRVPEVFQLQSVETHFKHMNILGDGFDLPDYDSIAIAGGFMDQNGWISNASAFESYLARAIVSQAHDRGGLVSYNHMFGTNTNATGGPNPQSILDELAAEDVYGADLLEVGYPARGGQNLANHIWVWDELAKQGIYVVGVGVTDAHGLYPGNWGQRANRMISWIYADQPTRIDLVEGLKRGRVYFGDLLLFDGTLDLVSASGFLMGQVVFTDRNEESITISIEGTLPGDLVRTYWDGQLVNTYVASGTTFSQTEVRQLGAANTFVRVGVTTSAGANKVFSNPIYFLRELPADGLASPKAGFEIGDIHSTLIESFTLTDISRELTSERSILTLEGSGNGGVIVLNVGNSITPDSVRFDAMSGTWELMDTLLVLSDLTGDGTITVSGGSPPVLTGIPDQTIHRSGWFAPINLDDYAEDVSFADSLLSWTSPGSPMLDVIISQDRIASVTVTDTAWTGTEAVTFQVTNPYGFSSKDTVLFTVLDLPPPPELVEPADGAVNQPTALTLTWSMSGTVTAYRLQVSSDSSFNSIFVDDSTLTAVTYLLDSLSNGAAYFWKVGARGAAGWGPWSERRSFSTIIALPGVVLPELPADGSVLAADSVLLRWRDPGPLVDRFWMELDSDSAFTSAVIDSAVLDTAKVIGGLNNDSTYYWRVRAHNIAGWGAFSETQAFSLDIPPGIPPVPQPLSPADGATGVPTTVSFFWNSVNGFGESEVYHLMLAGDSLFAVLVVNDSTLADTTRQVDSLENGTTYYWRVRAINETGGSPWSARRGFRTIVTLPGVVTLVEPDDSSTVTGDSIAFRWNASWPEVDAYRLEFDSDETFQTAFVDSSIVDTLYSIAGLGDDTRYWWRVTARNAAGWGQSSETRTFLTDIPAQIPPAPALLAPADNSTNQPIPLLLSWSPVETFGDTVHYHMQVSGDSLFATLFRDDSTIVDTTFLVDSLEGATEYYWRVFATTEAGSGPWSSVWSFRTIVPLPDTLHLLMPEDHALVTTAAVPLSWTSGTPEVDRYWLEVDTSAMFATAATDSMLTDTTTVFSQALDDRTYWWRVRAHNAAGWGGLTPARQFSVDLPVPPPATPALLIPPDNSVDVQSPVVFSWRSVDSTARSQRRVSPVQLQKAAVRRGDLPAGPLRSAVERETESMVSDSLFYHFQLSTDSTLLVLVAEDSTLADTTIQVDSLGSSMKHYWRVSARSSAGTSDWSETWTFTTMTVTAPPSIPCNAISMFQTRCRPGGKIQMRVILRNSTEYAGEVVTFSADTTVVNATMVTNGTHSKAEGMLNGQATGSHLVTLLLPGDCFDPVTVICTATSGMEEKWWWDEETSFEVDDLLSLQQLPEKTELLENFPNPFNPVTTIRFALTADSRVQIRIHDLLGRVVKTLVADDLPAGYHSTIWEGDSDSGTDVASGIYFYSMDARDDRATLVQTRKLILLR